MKPTGEIFGDKWIVREHHVETASSTVQGLSAVREIIRYWTGSEWSKVENLALMFDPQREVKDYIERLGGTP